MVSCCLKNLRFLANWHSVQSFIIKIRLDAYIWTVYRRYSAFKALADEVSASLSAFMGFWHCLVLCAARKDNSRHSPVPSQPVRRLYTRFSGAPKA